MDWMHRNWLQQRQLQVACVRLTQLVHHGMGRLRTAGQSDDLDRRKVHLRYGWCLGRVSAVEWEHGQPEPSCGLFFYGLRRLWWGAWQRFCDWQTPREPAAVTAGDWLFLSARGARLGDLKLILRIVRYGEVIPSEEYACATLLAG